MVASRCPGRCRYAAVPPRHRLPRQKVLHSVAGPPPGPPEGAALVGAGATDVGGAEVAVGGTGVDVGAGVAVARWVGVAVCLGLAVDVAVGSVGDPAEQAAMETVFVSIVTAPVRAKALPGRMVALVFRVMLADARMLPSNAVPVPRVAELPTCQNTLQPEPLLIMTTDELLAVVSVLPIWKTKSALGLPRALRVSVPVRLSRRRETIDARRERQSAQILTSQVEIGTGRPASALYAVVTSTWACCATASVWCTVSSQRDAPARPVIEVPGQTPRSPMMVVGPVLVTVEATQDREAVRRTQ